MKKIIHLFLFSFSVLLIAGCNVKKEEQDRSLSLLETEVSFEQGLTLPEGATLEIRLEDVSKMDVASELISSATREIKSAPPYTLQLAFSNNEIKNNHRYSLQASIRAQGKLVFISTSHIDPFAVGSATPIKIKVDPVGR